MRVNVDREMCIGAGNCVRLAPGVFDQSDDDGLNVVLVAEPPADQHEAVRRAIDACPTNAISILDS